jgi:AmiR/NasT family two-component response regulator
MTEATHTNQLWPSNFVEEAVVWQAVGILMQRFDLDGEQALEVLRKRSTSTRTRMCVIAEQVIDHSDQ